MQHGKSKSSPAARGPFVSRRTLSFLALGGAALLAVSVAAARPASSSTFALGGGVTRIESLPFTIDACGRYVVGRCLTGVAGQNGITIAAGVSDVTINLGGFTLAGARGSLDGIHATSFSTNVVVRNGTLRDWGGDGVDLEAASNTRISDVLSCGNGSRGIVVGDESILDRCLVRDNGGDGICAERCAIVTNCVSTLNEGHGIVAGINPNVNSGSVIRSSTACFNSAYGIRIAPAGVVSDCAVVQNSGGAILANFALVRGNSAGGSIDATSSTEIENHEY